MSDYVHEKVVRLPFPKGLFDRNGEDPWDSEEELKNILGELWEKGNTYTFKMGYSDEAHYIDWCYYYSYGEEPGEWGNVRLLTKKELDAIKPYFDKLGFPYSDNELRLVDYCYYNSSEPPDYYELATEGNDDSELFFKK